MFVTILMSVALACSVAHGSFQPLGVPFKVPVTVASGFAAHVIFSNLTLPRGITFDDVGTLLVVERGVGVTAFVEAPNRTGWERTVVIANPNFTQGIQVHGNQLFVSTGGEAQRYTYDSKTRSVSGDVQVLVTGIPADGDLPTHTLQLEHTDEQATNLLISSGPLTNIDVTARDPSSGRSQIRRFAVPPCNTTAPPQVFLQGELLGFGIRNPAGVAFSPTNPKLLYVAENGASIDNVTGLTAPFVNDNPADELDVIDLLQPALSFGFPDCTTLWNPFADPIGDPQYTNLSRGDQISLLLDPVRNNEWCQNRSNNEPPVLSFQAHSVPLDIKFYEPQFEQSDNGFPVTFANDAFVSFHGSFNRRPPTGYGVVHVPFTDSRPASSNYTFLIQAANINTCPGKCIRPVGLAFGPDGRLYVSSDTSGEASNFYYIEETEGHT